MNSQAGQDNFVLNSLKHKHNGYFIEIGSNDYKFHNNSFAMEEKYNWNGIMVEYDHSFLENYKLYRSNSLHLIEDATAINYRQFFDDNNVPENIDYLQIDLDVDNESTIKTLEIFDNDIFDKYKFATVTFETDIYRGNYFNTRSKSREIFKKHGYILVFPDVEVEHDGKNLGAFEDWYVHPELVDMEHVQNLIHLNALVRIGKNFVYA